MLKYKDIHRCVLFRRQQRCQFDQGSWNGGKSKKKWNVCFSEVTVKISNKTLEEKNRNIHLSPATQNGTFPKSSWIHVTYPSCKEPTGSDCQMGGKTWTFKQISQISYRSFSQLAVAPGFLLVQATLASQG